MWPAGRRLGGLLEPGAWGLGLAWHLGQLRDGADASTPHHARPVTITPPARPAGGGRGARRLPVRGAERQGAHGGDAPAHPAAAGHRRGAPPPDPRGCAQCGARLRCDGRRCLPCRPLPGQPWPLERTHTRPRPPACPPACPPAGVRTDTSIAVETAQCFSTHHVAMLVGYGAHAVCPYLAFETCRQWRCSPRTENLIKAGKVRLID